MTMVDLMLNDLRRPARIGSMLLFKVLIQIVHFDFFVSCTGSHTIQGQASFFCLKCLFLLCRRRNGAAQQARRALQAVRAAEC